MITIKQLNEIFKNYVSDNLVLKTYKYADPTEVDALNNIIYPFMCAFPVNTSVNNSTSGTNTTINRKFNFIFCDIQNNDNYLSSGSDMEIAAINFYSYLYNYNNYNLNISDCNITPFFERDDANLIGYNLDVSIICNYSANTNDIPTSVGLV